MAEVKAPITLLTGFGGVNKIWPLRGAGLPLSRIPGVPHRHQSDSDFRAGPFLEPFLVKRHL